MNEPAPNDIAAENLRWAWALIDGLASAGVVHAVISPGSRSTPLALACREHPAVRVWVQVDERCAGFFALGLGRATGCPALVIGTSGSAPAHWYPAVIEASEGEVPMILLSADRPPELHGCGANQTTDQRRLFGVHVRAFHDLPAADSARLGEVTTLARWAAAQSLAGRRGPVHLNVPFREPLVARRTVELPAPSPAGPVAVDPGAQPSRETISRLAGLVGGRRGVIVCGWGTDRAGFPAAVTDLAGRLDWPILADPLSGLRFGRHRLDRVMTHYDACLRSSGWANSLEPECILRFGAMPVSKATGEFLARAPADTFLLVEPNGRPHDPQRRATESVAADPAAFCRALAVAAPLPAPAGWFDRFAAAERAAAPTPEGGPAEASVIRALLAALPREALLFSGNSMPVRDLDSWSGKGAEGPAILANRGVSGIDGNISTLAGLTAAHTGPVVGLIGDIAFCHDLGGLLAAREAGVTLVVLNNGGGGIFGYLPQAGLEGFHDLWLTPTGLDLELAARLYGFGFRRVATADGFAPALSHALRTGGPQLIEVMIEREASLAAHRRYWESVGERLNQTEHD